ncbi:MAG: phosphoribosyltransferase family protein [Candidatus Azambacteria bacterium]|nr:phosphoribosyltransferase family protein [Candidatus Azambacteria bacterium]
MPTLKEQILDIVFPRHCLGCDILLGDESRSYVCRSCLKTISFTKGFACAFCKSPVKNGKTCPYCIKDHFLDRLLVATSYENPLIEKMLKTMKYRFVVSLADDIAGLMIKYLKKRLANNPVFDGNTMMVIPVPLHFKRLNWRGFNQAEIVSVKIAEHFCWPMITNALKRRRNPKPQTNMPDKFSRIENAKNLFLLNPIYGDRKTIDFSKITVLLIDDISTTGSTLNDCARALKGAGAKEVIGFVFARGKI